eukprot:tig00000093_g3471.t1
MRRRPTLSVMVGDKENDVALDRDLKASASIFGEPRKRPAPSASGHLQPTESSKSRQALSARASNVQSAQCTWTAAPAPRRSLRSRDGPVTSTGQPAPAAPAPQRPTTAPAMKRASLGPSSAPTAWAGFSETTMSLLRSHENRPISAAVSQRRARESVAPAVKRPRVQEAPPAHAAPAAAPAAPEKVAGHHADASFAESLESFPVYEAASLGAPSPPVTPILPHRSAPAAAAADEDAEVARLRRRVAELESAVAERDACLRTAEGMWRAEMTALRERAERAERELKCACGAGEEAAAAERERAGRREAASQRALAEAKARAEELEERAREHAEAIGQLSGRLREAEAARRRLHNEICELRGNIRVVCRYPEEEAAPAPAGPVPPALPGRGSSIVVTAPGIGCAPPSAAAVAGMPALTSASERTLRFEFSRVLGPSAAQEEVYAEVAPLVQSALDGYAVCIFAYGATGSGKTYTMEGPAWAAGAPSDEAPGEDLRGIIPRALEELFERAGEMRGRHEWRLEMTASFLEIYNEAIRDLLAPAGPGAAHAAHEIRHDKDGQAVVTGLTTVPVSDRAHLAALLAAAAGNRATHATACNERSSRSHAVFQLRLQGAQARTGRSLRTTVTLVDLAGSERVKVSGASGERLREAQCINRSLTALGNVIHALSAHENHVPYRDSKLTHLLQPCLASESAKICMLLNISPIPEQVDESICSLRFGAKAAAVERRNQPSAAGRRPSAKAPPAGAPGPAKTPRSSSAAASAKGQQGG